MLWWASWEQELPRLVVRSKQHLPQLKWHVNQIHLCIEEQRKCWNGQSVFVVVCGKHRKYEWTIIGDWEMQFITSIEGWRSQTVIQNISWTIFDRKIREPEWDKWIKKGTERTERKKHKIKPNYK